MLKSMQRVFLWTEVHGTLHGVLLTFAFAVYCRVGASTPSMGTVNTSS